MNTSKLLSASQRFLLPSASKAPTCNHYIDMVAPNKSVFAKVVESHKVSIENLGEIVSSPMQFLPEVQKSVTS